MTSVEPSSDEAVESESLGVPWHLSERTTTQLGVGGSPDRHDRDDEVDRPAADERATLEPLWWRLVSGQSVAWRIRRLGKALRTQRRRFARAVLRSVGRQPEIRRTLASGHLVSAVRESWHRRRRSRAAKDQTRPVICTDIDVLALPESHLLRRHVELRPISSPSTGDASSRVDRPGRLEPCPDGRVRCLSAAGEVVIDLIGPVDVEQWSPVGFPQRAAVETIRLDAVLESSDAAIRRRQMAGARRARSVTCSTASAVDELSVARAILELAASGAPLTAGRLPDAVRGELPPELIELIDSTRRPDLQSSWARELHSIRLRREVLTRFSARGRWSHIGSVVGSEVRSVPAVSVLLPSNRPDDVVEAARQVASQTGVEVQLIVGLHGSHMPPDLPARIDAVFPGDLVVERLPDSMNLGQVLNVLTERADRPLVAKWDDDDWYAPCHLADLVMAREYSGAPLVGKAAEFVYLEALDVTIRRFATGSERWSTTVAGGTLLLSTDDLQRVRWADVPRQVDRRLIEAMAHQGLQCFRTHGFGYVLRRRSHELADHTWNVDDAYFLRHSVDQRPGLDLEFADVRCRSAS